jgi:hypothetical protein
MKASHRTQQIEHQLRVNDLLQLVGWTNQRPRFTRQIDMVGTVVVESDEHLAELLDEANDKFFWHRDDGMLCCSFGPWLRLHLDVRALPDEDVAEILDRYDPVF